MEDQERSESGSPIYRYENEARNEFKPAFGDEENIQQISEHIEKHVGDIHLVFHELISDQIHIDVYWIKPSEEFPFNTLVTSGMSDIPMCVPEEFDSLKYSELCILLPSDWKIDQEAFKDENNYWPIRWLKTIARFPHEYNTWVGFGHTIPNGENADPFADNTKFGCMMLVPSITLGEGFDSLKISDEKTINFYCLIPLYKEEMEFKLKNGSEALFDKFDKFDFSEIVTINRKNTCLKKGLFGLW